MSTVLYFGSSPNVPSRSAERGDVLVVPTKRRIRYLIRELAASSKSPIVPPAIFTLELLAHAAGAELYKTHRIVEEPVRTLLFNQAILSSGKLFKYFRLRERDKQLPLGTFDKIVSVITRLKESGVYPPTLADELAFADEDEQAKLEDLIRIYQTYDDLLASVNGFDPEGVFKALAFECSDTAFVNGFRRLFPDAGIIHIVGFDEFTLPELQFLRKLTQTGAEIWLEFDFVPGNRPLFAHLEENYQKLVEIGFRPVDERGSMPQDTGAGQLDLFAAKPSVSGGPAFIYAHIAAQLFNARDDARPVDASRLVTLVAAKDRIAEVEAICKIIKELHAANPKRDLSRICVVTHLPERYTPLFREQFEKFGIPGNITDRYALSQSPVVVAIMAMLDMVVRGFRREDVLRAISSTYLDFRREGKPVDRTNLTNVSLELRISAGINTWLRKIDNELARLQQRPESPDELEPPRLARTLAALRRARDEMQWMDELFAPLRRCQSPASFESCLLEILAALRVSRRIVAVRPDDVTVEKDARALAKFLDVVKQTTSLLEYQQGKTEAHPLKFYVDQLKVAIGQERYNVREQFGAGVLVTSIEETRGLPLEVMIVAGLVDGEFPSVYQSEIFLSGKRLKEREQHHVWENRYLFYQAVTNFSEHLYLTYPQQDADLDLVRSSFVDAVLRILEVTKWSYPRESPLDDCMYSADDMLRLYGKTNGAVELPETLANDGSRIHFALQVEASRSGLHTLPEFEGTIGAAVSPEMQEKLAGLKQRVYSVSQLETYGKCPFQFFAQRLLRLNVIEDLEEEFSPRERGSVLHDILFEFYLRRREEGMPLLAECSEEEFTAAHRQLLAIAEKKLAAIDVPDTFWELEKELILGDKLSGRGILREFLEAERHRTSSLRPAYFEVGFGSNLGEQSRLDPELDSKDPLPAGNVLLRGKVDRVEMNDGRFSIVDYKTGTVQIYPEEFRNGVSLQLPIYLFAIEQLLAARGKAGLRPAAGVLYQLRLPVGMKVALGDIACKDEFPPKQKTEALLTEQELRSVINNAVNMVNSFVDGIAAGRFPLTSFDKIDRVCTYCEYKTTCRIQTARPVGKPTEE